MRKRIRGVEPTGSTKAGLSLVVGRREVSEGVYREGPLGDN